MLWFDPCILTYFVGRHRSWWHVHNSNIIYFTFKIQGLTGEYYDTLWKNFMSKIFRICSKMFQNWNLEKIRLSLRGRLEVKDQQSINNALPLNNFRVIFIKLAFGGAMGRFYAHCAARERGFDSCSDHIEFFLATDISVCTSESIG